MPCAKVCRIAAAISRGLQILPVRTHREHDQHAEEVHTAQSQVGEHHQADLLVSTPFSNCSQKVRIPARLWSPSNLRFAALATPTDCGNSRWTARASVQV